MNGAPRIRLPRLTIAVLAALLAAMVFAGIYPSPLTGVIEQASAALF